MMPEEDDVKVRTRLDTFRIGSSFFWLFRRRRFHSLRVPCRICMGDSCEHTCLGSIGMNLSSSDFPIDEINAEVV